MSSKIEDIKATIKKEVPIILGDDLVKIVLFGSYARGDFTNDSDIDIALITKCDRLEVKKYNDALLELATDIAMDNYSLVNFICLPEIEFDEKKEWYSFFKNINNEGIVLNG